MKTLPLNDYDFSAGSLHFRIATFSSLESTNSFLKEHHSSWPDFTVICAQTQTRGRGRFERTWQTGNGKGLAFSINIPVKNIPRNNWSNLSQVMALSICLFLEDLGISSCIRWPNDILINEAKICGILGELIQSEDGYHLILGTGLNINENRQDFSGLDRPATSLLIETGEEMTPPSVLEGLLSKFSAVFTQFAVSGFETLITSVSRRLFIPDHPVKVLCGEKEIMGRITGLSEKGAVLLQTESGVMEIVSGEITSRI